MLPSVYQHQQQQQQQNQHQLQHSNELNCGTNNQMCSMMMTFDSLKSATVQNMSPPFREFDAQLNSNNDNTTTTNIISNNSNSISNNNSNKGSQLKETHSVLVKILESAPIPSNASNTVPVPSFTKIAQTVQQQQQQQHQTNQPPQSTYHRKRNKHLNAISAQHCDMDKSSDEELGCNSNSSASSNASSEAEIVCPIYWKKTRIAREWNQSQKMDEDTIEKPTAVITNTNTATTIAATAGGAATVTAIPTINLNM